MTTEYFARALEPFATVLVAALLCCVLVFASAEESDKSRVENWWQQPWEIDARIYGWLSKAPAAMSVNGEIVFSVSKIVLLQVYADAYFLRLPPLYPKGIPR